MQTNSFPCFCGDEICHIGVRHASGDSNAHVDTSLPATLTLGVDVVDENLAWVDVERGTERNCCKKDRLRLLS